MNEIDAWERVSKLCVTIEEFIFKARSWRYYSHKFWSVLCALLLVTLSDTIVMKDIEFTYPKNMILQKIETSEENAQFLQDLYYVDQRFLKYGLRFVGCKKIKKDGEKFWKIGNKIYKVE